MAVGCWDVKRLLSFYELLAVVWSRVCYFMAQMGCDRALKSMGHFSGAGSAVVKPYPSVHHSVQLFGVCWVAGEPRETVKLGSYV